MNEHEATVLAVATSQEEVGLRGAEASGSALKPTVVVALDVTLAIDVPGGGNENEITALGKGAALKIMDGYSISHPKLVEHLLRGHAQRLAQRLVAATALVHVQRVEPGLVDVAVQERLRHDFGSGPSGGSGACSSGALGPG